MDKTFSAIRHIVGGLGATLVGFNLADQETITEAMGHIEAILGGLMFLAALSAGVIEKFRRHRLPKPTDTGDKV